MIKEIWLLGSFHRGTRKATEYISNGNFENSVYVTLKTVFQEFLEGCDFPGFGDSKSAKMRPVEEAVGYIFNA